MFWRFMYHARFTYREVLHNRMLIRCQKYFLPIFSRVFFISSRPECGASRNDQMTSGTSLAGTTLRSFSILASSPPTESRKLFDLTWQHPFAFSGQDVQRSMVSRKMSSKCCAAFKVSISGIGMTPFVQTVYDLKRPQSDFFPQTIWNFEIVFLQKEAPPWQMRVGLTGIHKPPERIAVW